MASTAASGEMAKVRVKGVLVWLSSKRVTLGQFTYATELWKELVMLCWFSQGKVKATMIKLVSTAGTG